MATVLKLTEKTIRSIEYVLPKLKYSCYIGNIAKWLENFETADRDVALDLLFYLEYISFNELQLRLTDQLKKALKKIPKTNDVAILPFGEYGKSSDLMVYLIKKTRYFKTKLSDFKKKRKRLYIERDISKIDPKKETSLIFIDDFIGSGNSFIKDYDKRFKKFIVDNVNISHDCFIIAAIAMDEGLKNIKRAINNIVVCAQTRRNAFDALHSVFKEGHGRDIMKSLTLKYGNLIEVDYDKSAGIPIYRPLGYDDVASLVAFDYGCPNNTLSVIWGSKKWTPIFPRFANDRMKQAAELKKTVAFYIGLMNRLGLDLYKDESIIINKKREIKYNTREDHALLTVLSLKRKKYDSLLICQIIGITEDELRTIELYGFKKSLLDKKGQITSIGYNYIDLLREKAKSYKNFLSSRVQFERKNLIYIPKSFN